MDFLFFFFKKLINPTFKNAVSHPLSLHSDSIAHLSFYTGLIKLKGFFDLKLETAQKILFKKNNLWKPHT